MQFLTLTMLILQGGIMTGTSEEITRNTSGNLAQTTAKGRYGQVHTADIVRPGHFR